jgi:hypothetical protein
MRLPAGAASRAAFLWLVLAGALADAGCAGLVGIEAPQDLTDSSFQDVLDSSVHDGPDSFTQDATDSPTQDATDSAAPDATDSSILAATDALLDALTDAPEGGALTDQNCGVCVSGTTEPCGKGGTQTCNAQCKWGACSVPNTIGCSDDTRDGFLNAAAFPRIAGCLGDWNEGSMRAPKTGVACGNKLLMRCTVPADLCAPAWHVCGTPPYGPIDISAKITNAQCTGETTGSFVAALGDLECDPCSLTGFGAVCCGNPCVQQNGSCVWANATPWVGVIGGHRNLCSDIINTYPTTMGALCCMD